MTLTFSTFIITTTLKSRLSLANANYKIRFYHQGVTSNIDTKIAKCMSFQTYVCVLCSCINHWHVLLSSLTSFQRYWGKRLKRIGISVISSIMKCNVFRNVCTNNKHTLNDLKIYERALMITMPKCVALSLKSSNIYVIMCLNQFWRLW